MAERTERDVLHHLIEVCRDGERGFRAAADHVHNPSMKSLFGELAEERERFATELLPHLRRLGGSMDWDGSPAGALHRRWIGLKGIISGRDHAMVAEAQRGEHAALDAYEEALDGMLPPTASELIEEQRDALKRANERIRALYVM